MAETSSHLFLHELSPQGLYLSCQVQVSERRALKPPKKGKQKLLDTSVSDVFHTDPLLGPPILLYLSKHHTDKECYMEVVGFSYFYYLRDHRFIEEKTYY